MIQIALTAQISRVDAVMSSVKECVFNGKKTAKFFFGKMLMQNFLQITIKYFNNINFRVYRNEILNFI